MFILREYKPFIFNNIAKMYYTLILGFTNCEALTETNPLCMCVCVQDILIVCLAKVDAVDWDLAWFGYWIKVSVPGTNVTL